MNSDKLYNVYVFNEMGHYFLVQVVADDSNEEEERYALRILRHLNAKGSCPQKGDEPGSEFTVGRTKGPGGGMAGWYLREPCEVVDLAKGEGWDLTVPVPPTYDFKFKVGRFQTRRTKPLDEITAGDIPPGLDAEDIATDFGD